MSPDVVGFAGEPSCDVCGQSNVIKHGHDRKGQQVYFCKSGRHYFTANGALPGRRVPPEQVGTALNSFFTGTSIGKSSRNLEPTFDTFPPSKASVYEWVVDYSRLAKAQTAKDKPKTGDTWVADELVTRIGGEKVWVWTVMDTQTRFILASHLSRTRTIRDAETLFKQAKVRAANPPKRIVTDRLAAYPEGIERVFGGDVKHMPSHGITAPDNNNMMERLNGSIRERTKVMRGMKSIPTARIVLDGWGIHYNYMRPHMGIKNRTPAEAAKLERHFTNWEDVARNDVRPYAQVRVQKERARILTHAGTPHPIRFKPPKPVTFATVTRRVQSAKPRMYRAAAYATARTRPAK